MNKGFRNVLAIKKVVICYYDILSADYLGSLLFFLSYSIILNSRSF